MEAENCVGESESFVLFAHQAAELYGSDKVLLYLLVGLMDSGIRPIVLLPSEGPLVATLRAKGLEVHIVPLVKIARSTFSVKGLLGLPIELVQSLRAISRVVRGRRIAVVYSNTVAVLAAGAWARIHRIPHLWHVHEIVIKPAVARRVFPGILRALSDRIVCNSTKTLQWIVREQPQLRERSRVIWNGQPKRPPINPAAVRLMRSNLSVPSDDVVVALVGRINKWKGQTVLIDAAGVLWERGIRNVHFLIVGGSAPTADGQLVVDDMRDHIDSSPARELISWMDFTDDIWSVWDMCDIAVVPSIDPEPFGMVAIEAMASFLPVVASSQGGLLEIVDEGVTGMLVQPNSPAALADAIEKLVSNPDLRRRMGRAGERRQSLMFSIETQVAETRNCLLEMSDEVV